MAYKNGLQISGPKRSTPAPQQYFLPGPLVRPLYHKIAFFTFTEDIQKKVQSVRDRSKFIGQRGRANWFSPTEEKSLPRSFRARKH